MKMSHLYIIQKQVNTASTLICSNDEQKPFKTASWFRINRNGKKLLKNQDFFGKSECIYNCTVFDYDTKILLQLKNNQGIVRQYQYGPIKFDKKLELILESLPNKIESLPVTFILNKNQKYQGQISFSKILADILTIDIKIQNIELQVQQPILNIWSDYQEIFYLKEEIPLQISLNLGKNKLQFVKSLSKIKIYSHSGNYLSVNFDRPHDKFVFLARLFMIVQLNKNIKQARFSQKQSSIYMNQSLRMSQINNLFTSTDWCSESMTPHVAIQTALDDFRNIVFTPKPQLERQIRDRGFPSFQSFLGMQQHSQGNKQTHRQLHRQSHKNFENIQTNQTIKAIKQQQIEQQTQVKNKNIKQQTRVKKPYQIINAANKNKLRLKTQSSKQRISPKKYSQVKPQQKKMQKLPYEKVCERNAFLQQQNRNLLLENIKLRYKIQILQNQNRKMTRSKEQMPSFLKVRDHQQKNYPQKKMSKNKSKQKSKRVFRFTQCQTRPRELSKHKQRQIQLRNLSNNFRSTAYAKICSTNNLSSFSPRDLTH